MTHDEMVALIRGGVPGAAGTWADLGAGQGNFTWALAELLGPAGVVYAVDQERRAMRQLRRRIDEAAPAATIHPVLADFTQPLNLPPLDGILLANALHFQREQAAVLRHVVRYLQPGSTLLLVEYNVTRARRWIPVPVPWARLPALIEAADLTEPTLIGTRRSPTTGIAMYAAVAHKPGD